MPLSQCNNITLRNIRMECKNFFNVGESDNYRLTDFTFENINVYDRVNAFDKNIIENTKIRNMMINGKKITASPHTNGTWWTGSLPHILHKHHNTKKHSQDTTQTQ